MRVVVPFGPSGRAIRRLGAQREKTRAFCSGPHSAAGPVRGRDAGAGRRRCRRRRFFWLMITSPRRKAFIDQEGVRRASSPNELAKWEAQLLFTTCLSRRLENYGTGSPCSEESGNHPGLRIDCTLFPFTNWPGWRCACATLPGKSLKAMLFVIFTNFLHCRWILKTKTS